MVIIFIFRFFDLLVSGLLTGVMIGIWLGPNPKSLSDICYIEYTQAFIQAFNIKMPVFLLLSIFLTLTSALLQSSVISIFIPLILATIFLAFCGIITRLGNQPINKQIMRWSKNYIPNKWEYLRDRWWYFHIFRTLFVLLAFILIVFTSLYIS
jgi:hypothetical protein